MLMQSSEVYARVLLPSTFLNGSSGDSSVSHEFGTVPGVGPWLSTELVPGYSGRMSRWSVKPFCFCQSQKTRSTKQWWKKKIGSRPAVSFSPMSPLAPSIGEASNWPGTSKPPTARWMLLCGDSIGTMAGVLPPELSKFHCAAEVVLEKIV